MSVGKIYFQESGNTKQIALFEYIERIDKEHFKFKYLHNGQELILPINQMKRILTEYEGTLDGKSCENCSYYNTENVRKDKNKAIAKCLRSGWEIYHKTPCFNYEEKR